MFFRLLDEIEFVPELPELMHDAPCRCGLVRPLKSGERSADIAKVSYAGFGGTANSVMQIAQSVEWRKSLRSGLTRLSLVRGNVDHPGLIKEFKGLRGVMLWHTEGSNPARSARNNSLL